jgi:UDP-GlcNAc:undecaprenyl-phosphate GlcNAc-1-phosphate transferase
MKTYLGVYFAATAISLLSTPLVVRLARALNIVDAPGIRKIHAQAIPRIGGVAIVLGMLMASIPMLFQDNVIGEGFRKFQAQVTALLVGGLFMFLVGLIDDVWDLRVRFKLLAQILAAVGVCVAGVRIDDAGINGLFTLRFGWVAWPITIFWIVGVTNAVNLIDGLDGLAAGIAAVTCGVTAVFAVYTGQPMMAVFMLALLGSLTGFLVFNFNPAKIFMGDCGTMFLGFVLAVSSVMCASKSSTLVGMALPALALGIPIFDTFFSILRRFEERRSIFAPDRCHIHHRLLDKGIRHRHVVILMYMVTLLAGGLGMVMMITRDTGSIMVFGCVSFLLILLFRIVGAVRFRDSITAIQRNICIARQTRHDRSIFERSVLRMREAKTFDGWWQAVCLAAEEMDFASLNLQADCRDGTIRDLSYRRQERELNSYEMINLVLPISHRRAGPPLRMEVAVHIDGSLEAAGRRVAFFSRLIEEHSLTKVPEPVRGAIRENFIPTPPGKAGTTRVGLQDSLPECTLIGNNPQLQVR